MVRMGDVWDRSVMVMRGRPAMLAAIAGLTLILPGVVSDVWQAFVPVSVGASLGTLAIGIAVLVLTIVGQLALVAAASAPGVTRSEALAIGWGRFGRALLVVLAMVFGAIVLFSPLFALLIAAGVDFAAAQRGAMQANMDAGLALAATAYCLIATVILLVLFARLMLIWPVVVTERLGVAALARSWSLSRGLTLRLIGVLILFGIVISALLFAVTSVTGIVLALLLGEAGRVVTLLMVALAVTLVVATAGVVQAVFTAQLYVAIVGEDAVAVR